MKISAVPFASLDPLTAYSLWKLRQDVFVVEQEAAYPDLDGRDLDPATRHVVMENDDGVVLGCARVLDDGQEWRIGRVALHRTVRGQGWADQIMQAALQVCPDRDVVLDAQSPLAGWYGTYGFVVTGLEFLDDGIPHLPMRLRRS
ncbi:MAG TPA: GNAT family N-acetyltransferase [Nocardioides sp.]|uniref:GNAT family N-acetyltransferase n=1 Tax=uncultured Nocardioides sp. TaxID=198441 RepID=UPI000EE47B51|nr:GNAT family N-acetyltransferase [uncultured Nocardioides sp.]HCB04348.1 GNAT family N-acetyltransferase [Nocardioides sp.]HRD63337.1 GNAT family N-acetyltransferase [Nocardioides sp.]HRI96529.1 GNAT family N-acetyltransferase [Nocardioides sp.]